MTISWPITTETAQLAYDTMLGRPVKGVPTKGINPMQHAHIDRIAGVPEGSYRRDPHRVYTAMLRNAGCCSCDQYIPENPLSMGSQGYESDKARGVTTGAHTIICDGMEIASPEDVIAHMERIVFPGLRRTIASFDEEKRVRGIIEKERAVQEEIGPELLKTGHGFIGFPRLAYHIYGYGAYFMAYALYPEVIEKYFALQADLMVLVNRAVARAYAEGGLPPLHRLDHDMADSRGTLVRIESLDRLWFPHFARSLEPLRKSGIRLVWHCDGNLMEMVPRLIDCGVSGFQGFQYEAGMDYEKICRMRAADGRELLIMAGVSVTTTLPHGTPQDVRKEMDWLVQCGPKRGLFLGCSSSITPGVPWENMQALLDGFHHYRTHGRD